METKEIKKLKAEMMSELFKKCGFFLKNNLMKTKHH